MDKEKEKAKVKVLPLDYPRTVYATFTELEAIKDGDQEPSASLLMMYDEFGEAEEQADEPGEWIAVYELKELIKVDKNPIITSRIKA